MTYLVGVAALQAVEERKRFFLLELERAAEPRLAEGSLTSITTNAMSRMRPDRD